MTPALPSVVVATAARAVLEAPQAAPWAQLWPALEGFGAMLMYSLLRVPVVSREQCIPLLLEQLALRGLHDRATAALAQDVIVVLRGDGGAAFDFGAAVALCQRLQSTTVAALRAECKTLAPPPSPPAVASPTLACPVAWLLTDKGCGKSKESEQVMAAARRLCLAEDSLPYPEFLSVLQEAYTQAQAQLECASSRTKVPVLPVATEQLAALGLQKWAGELRDLMTVLGTAAHVNRRRAVRALTKVSTLTVTEVLQLVQMAAEQSGLIGMLDDADDDSNSSD